MTNDLPDLSAHTQTTFQRLDHGTQVREALWTFTGMRSLSAAFRDGGIRVALITHDNTKRRQASLSAHHITELSVESDDDLALCIRVRTEDDTPLTMNFFGVTLNDLLEAVAKAVAEKEPITEDSDA